MANTVDFRPFEERDIDFIYACKNDEKLNSMIVGQFRRYSREDAEQWVRGVIRADRDDMKFWAICTSDSEKRIVGWVSFSEIDMESRSACHHGLVIGDPDYKDGTAMFEAMLFSMDYAFSTLRLHRIYGWCLSEHKTTPHMNNALGFVLEGRRRDAFYKNNRYYDLLDYGLLETEYQKNLESGRYNLNTLMRNFVKSLKNKKI